MKRLILSILGLGVVGHVLLGATLAEAERSGPRNIYGVRTSKNIYGMRGGRTNLSSNKFYSSQGQGKGLRHNYFGSPYTSERQTGEGSSYLSAQPKASWGYWDYSLEEERMAAQRREQKKLVMGEPSHENSVGSDFVRF